MDDRPIEAPASLAAVQRGAAEAGFDAACDERVGSLLRSLARSLGDARLLELGTGPGTSTAWLLDGMSPGATLLTIDDDPAVIRIAQEVLGSDPRVTFEIGDGAELLGRLAGGRGFDLVFADTWPGKYRDLGLALDLVAPGGFYVVDDLLPQPNWPDGHGDAVVELLAALDSRSDLTVTRMAWATGVVVAVRS